MNTIALTPSLEQLLSVRPYQMQSLKKTDRNDVELSSEDKSSANFPLDSRRLVTKIAEATIFVDFAKEDLKLAETLISLIKMKENTVLRPDFNLKSDKISEDFENKFKTCNIVFIVFEDGQTSVDWLIAQLLYCSYISHSRFKPLTVVYSGSRELSEAVSSKLVKYRIFDEILSEQALRQRIKTGE